MCGRYVLSMRPSQYRRYLEDRNMPVWDAPEDEADGSPRQSYNFAPSYNGMVYRPDVPDRGARPGGSSKEGGDSALDSQGVPSAVEDASRADTTELDADGPEDPSWVDVGAEMGVPSPNAEDAARVQDDAAPKSSHDYSRYKLQSMRWGLVPSWTKRNPGYTSVMKTINCRSDSLSRPGGLWSTMKTRKRCIVLADGFYEWLKVGTKEKVPHYIKRKDGQPMLFAGLWDCVTYQDSGEKVYTYTIITVDSNPALKFIHDRMPAIFEPASPELRTWLDASRCAWTRELQDVLRPSQTELDIYPVSKEVGKVGNNSPSFIIPVASKDNKNNIANFFSKPSEKKDAMQVKTETQDVATEIVAPKDLEATAAKRGASPVSPSATPPAKVAVTESPKKPKISATSNSKASPSKKSQAEEGSKKITSFFTKNSL